MSRDSTANWEVTGVPKTVVCFVDDQGDGDAKRYRDRLAEAEGFDCLLVPPRKFENLDDLVTKEPDLFLIDYELRQVQPDGTRVAYQGLTLAAEIRMRSPDRPIVLITRRSILDELDSRGMRQLVEHMPSCDELITKAQLDDDLDGTRQLLVSIAEGFRTLRPIRNKSWASLVETMGANDDESLTLREAAPPLPKGEWTAFGAAGWIRNVVLRLPGIVYDPVNAATRLGISIESFGHNAVQNLLRPAKYTGIFAPAEGRWWRARLFGVAKELAVDNGLDGPVNRTFSKVVAQVCGFEPDPAKCVWDGAPLADWVCFLMRKPVKMRNSLRYYPDNRPAMMDNARVSFRSVREHKGFHTELLDSEGQALYEQVMTLPEPPEP